MQPWQIIVIIVTLIALFYVAVQVFVIYAILGFKGKLKRRLFAISIVLNERRDVLLAEIDSFRSVGVAFRDSDELVFRTVRELDLSKVKAGDVHQIHMLINDAESRFKFLSGKNVWATKTEEYEALSESARELETNFRQSVMGYNTDLLGYNYWVKIPLSHWIPWLLNWRAKERIG